MNVYLLIAGVIGVLASAGHFSMGYKMYLSPVLKSNLSEDVKRTMYSLFHYMSVVMVLSSCVLLFAGMGFNPFSIQLKPILIFICALFFMFALIQFIIALSSDLKNPVLKLFQWIFWDLIAIFSLIGILNYNL